MCCVTCQALTYLAACSAPQTLQQNELPPALTLHPNCPRLQELPLPSRGWRLHIALLLASSTQQDRSLTPPRLLLLHFLVIFFWTRAAAGSVVGFRCYDRGVVALPPQGGFRPKTKRRGYGYIIGLKCDATIPYAT